VTEHILAIRYILPMPHASNFVFTAMLIGSIPWCGAIAFLGLAKRFLSATNRALAYLKEAVFPWFLLHMLTLTVFTYLFLKQTSLPAVLQAAAIVSGSAVTLAVLYELVIKKSAFLRFILGMKSPGT
jgi:glucans biosynthesis protein C